MALLIVLSMACLLVSIFRAAGRPLTSPAEISTLPATSERSVIEASPLSSWIGPPPLAPCDRRTSTV
jgi:hypothetical protein